PETGGGWGRSAGGGVRGWSVAPVGVTEVRGSGGTAVMRAWWSAAVLLPLRVTEGHTARPVRARGGDGTTGRSGRSGRRRGGEGPAAWMTHVRAGEGPVDREGGWRVGEEVGRVLVREGVAGGRAGVLEMGDGAGQAAAGRGEGPEPRLGYGPFGGRILGEHAGECTAGSGGGGRPSDVLGMTARPRRSLWTTTPGGSVARQAHGQAEHPGPHVHADDGPDLDHP
ncbi:MAG: hypothetical protein K0R62_7960, partial [Nonomuraea muscovyensis]|nr:hypothetical protein [Nonomuraea muscovyensis]